MSTIEVVITQTARPDTLYARVIGCDHPNWRKILEFAIDWLGPTDIVIVDDGVEFTPATPFHTPEHILEEFLQCLNFGWPLA